MSEKRTATVVPNGDAPRNENRLPPVQPPGSGPANGEPAVPAETTRPISKARPAFVVIASSVAAGAMLGAMTVYGLAVRPQNLTVAALRADAATAREQARKAEEQARASPATMPPTPLPSPGPVAASRAETTTPGSPFPGLAAESTSAGMSGWIEGLLTRENAVKLREEGQALQQGQLDAQLARFQQMQTQTEAMLARLRQERQQGNRPLAFTTPVTSGAAGTVDPKIIVFTPSLPPDLTPAVVSGSANSGSVVEVELARPNVSIVLADRPVFAFRTTRRDGATAAITLKNAANGVMVETATLPIPATGEATWRPTKPLTRNQVYEWQVTVSGGGEASAASARPARFRVADAATARRENRTRLERAAVLMRAGLLDAATDLLDAIKSDAPGTPEAVAADRGLGALGR
jgi:hypothetical protein